MSYKTPRNPLTTRLAARSWCIDEMLKIRQTDQVRSELIEAHWASLLAAGKVGQALPVDVTPVHDKNQRQVPAMGTC